jgi:para-aminobenzoate synthetase/4-amino-4-deoxychorismate lyase
MAAVPEPVSKLPAHVWRRRTRPDRQQGVFETLLVVDGRPIELDAHLARLATSLAELFPDHPAPQLGEEIRTRTRDLELGSIRVTVAPKGSDRLKTQISVREVEPALVFPGSPGALLPISGRKAPIGWVALHSLAVTGGLGPHKWADRALLEDAQSGLPADALPLVVDGDGTVLEASRANVFAVRGGALFTPPADGRILPGITRARTMEIARAAELDTREAELCRGDLLAADEVFLTSSVRGIERVCYVDGAPLSDGDDVTDRLAIELWQVWAGAKTAF